MFESNHFIYFLVLSFVYLAHSTFKGQDAQLDAAIVHLKDLISTLPVDVPKAPPYPDKSFKKMKE